MGKLLAVVFACALMLSVASAQEVDVQKLQSLSVAISHAEGFGVRRAIPTRYHNPGDLKSTPRLSPLPGQRGLGKGQHIVFRNDQAGWKALNDYLLKMVDGRSRRYKPDMTIKDIARIYAARWRPWVKIVTTELGVPANTKLAEFLYVQEIAPPEIPVLVTNPDFPEIFNTSSLIIPDLASPEY